MLVSLSWEVCTCGPIYPCDLGVHAGVCMRGAGLCLLVSLGLPHLASLPSPGLPPEGMEVGTCSEGGFLG